MKKIIKLNIEVEIEVDLDEDDDDDYTLEDAKESFFIDTEGVEDVEIEPFYVMSEDLSSYSYKIISRKIL